LTDPLEQLKDTGGFSGSWRAIATRLNILKPHVTQQGKELGLVDLGSPDSAGTNDKARLRLSAERHGFRMLPGECVDQWKSC